MMEWEKIKVKKLAKIKTGRYDANHAVENGKYEFFTCALLSSKANTFSFDDDAIILPGNGANVGEVLYYSGKLEAYQRTYILSEIICNPRYLYYAFKKYWKNRVQKRQVGSATNYIKINDIEDLEIPLLPLEIQQKIANKLDKAQELIDKRKQQIEKYDEFLQSLFLDMFGDPVSNPKGWELGTIRDIVSEVKYGTSKKANEGSGKYPLLRMNNITYAGNWNFSSLQYIDLDEKDEGKYLVSKGDMLFNRTNSKELVGKTAVYKKNEKMAYAGYLIKVRANERANTDYISAFLNSKYGKKVLFSMCKSIVGMANINAQELQNINILLPPLNLQNKFAQIVEKTEKEKQKLEKNLSELENNFNNIMQEAFKNN